MRVLQQFTREGPAKVASRLLQWCSHDPSICGRAEVRGRVGQDTGQRQAHKHSCGKPNSACKQRLLYHLMLFHGETFVVLLAGVLEQRERNLIPSNASGPYEEIIGLLPALLPQSPSVGPDSNTSTLRKEICK